MNRKALFFTLSLSAATGATLVACGGGDDAAPAAAAPTPGANTGTEPDSDTHAAARDSARRLADTGAEPATRHRHRRLRRHHRRRHHRRPRRSCRR